MATQSDDTDKLVAFIDDARRQKIAVMPPDVNESSADFSVEESSIRFGLQRNQERRRAVRSISFWRLVPMVQEVLRPVQLLCTYPRKRDELKVRRGDVD